MPVSWELIKDRLYMLTHLSLRRAWCWLWVTSTCIITWQSTAMYRGQGCATCVSFSYYKATNIIMGAYFCDFIKSRLFPKPHLQILSPHDCGDGVCSVWAFGGTAQPQDNWVGQSGDGVSLSFHPHIQHLWVPRQRAGQREDRRDRVVLK